MTGGIKRILTFLLVVGACGLCAAQDDVVMKAMHDELGRSKEIQLTDLGKPYFIAYRVQDINQLEVSATLGSLATTNPSRTRFATVEIRVGDYKFDNTNFISLKGMGRAHMFSGFGEMPLDNNYLEIRRALWLLTDGEYKQATESLTAKKAALQNHQQTEELPDFSKESPAKLLDGPVNAKPDQAALEQLAREVSAVFRETPEIFPSSVEFNYRNVYTRYLNSEGSEYTEPNPILTLEIKAQAQGEDGLPLTDSLEYCGRTLSDLPSKQELITQTKAMAERLKKLRTAKSLDRYNGPVLFEDRAAAEVFAAIFAPALTGTRNPLTDSPQAEGFLDQLTSRFGGGSFVDRIGGRVLPTEVSVVDDPQKTEYNGVKLMGFSKIDDEAVPTRQNKLVESGMLKTVLTTRDPVGTLQSSTGSRHGAGPAPTNLFLTAEKGVSDADLRAQMLKMAKARGFDYGIVVRRSGEGINPMVRMAGMMSPEQSKGAGALLEVYKVFTDGHEELVRGAEVSNITPASFKDIVGVGNKPAVFNNIFVPGIATLFMMGASGNINGLSDFQLSSFVAPSLLFEELTLKKAAGPFPNPPIVAPPAGQ